MPRTKLAEKAKEETEKSGSSLVERLQASRYKTWTSSDEVITVKYKRPSLAYLFQGGHLPAFFTEALIDTLNQGNGTTVDKDPLRITKESIIEMESGIRQFAIDTIVEPKFHVGETDEAAGVYSIDLFEEYLQEYFNIALFNLNDLAINTRDGEVSADSLARFPNG
jgi:hypothetical protein